MVICYADVAGVADAVAPSFCLSTIGLTPRTSKTCRVLLVVKCNSMQDDDDDDDGEEGGTATVEMKEINL
ncbi:hypothetical protein PV325_009173 [Microctonus aethiopoides]|nr:hypothetical protein PV325_009173 [Microctonus aethiopoides]